MSYPTRKQKEGTMLAENAVKNVKTGAVTWEVLKADLMELPKETLCDMVSMWIHNWQAVHNYWITYVERDFGEANATRLDSEVVTKNTKIQGKNLKNLLGLGDDMKTAAFVVKHASTQWTPSGFDWVLDEVTDERVVFHIISCPMSTFRKSHNLEVYPCRDISTPLYDALVKTVNPKMKIICTHAHPDKAIEGLMCAWEIVYEK
jgi:hypothetical protein